MNKKLLSVLMLSVFSHTVFAEANHDKPATTEDVKANIELHQNYFKKRHSDIPFEDFANGVYALNPDAKAQADGFREGFPQYEEFVERGAELVEANDGLEACVGRGAESFPYFDDDKKQIVTLTDAINGCLAASGKETLKANGNDMIAITAYFASEARGKTRNIELPTSSEGIAAYVEGRREYFARRGQLNFNCASCHYQSSGQKLRSEMVSPTLGHSTHWPVTRTRSGKMNTLHTRFRQCYNQLRAKAPSEQHIDLKEIEYFMGLLDSGLPMTGPDVRS